MTTNYEENALFYESAGTDINNSRDVAHSLHYLSVVRFLILMYLLQKLRMLTKIGKDAR
jgi:hypothetical protein